MADILPPSPTDAPFGSYNWQDWYIKVRNAINAAASISWSQITNFTGSNLTQIVTRSHQSLQNILGNGVGHIPAAGTANQVLAKIDATDYNTHWATITLPSQLTFTAPTLLNSWVNFGGAFTPAGYTKDGYGMVKLRGLVKSGTLGSPIFTLPSGYIPSFTHIFAVASNDLFGEVRVDTSGNVFTAVASNLYVSLDGISFVGL